MFTQIITPHEKPVIIDIPDAYLGHRLNITVSELAEEKAGDAERYSFENALKFWRSHRVDLSHFKFNREEANER
jgi:hypothetical protein